MKTISYAISYIEWSDDIESIPRAEAGKLLKALMTATFEETDSLTNFIKEEQGAITDAFTSGDITLEAWTARMRELSELSCRWLRMKTATEKSVSSYKKRSAANSENGKKKGKKKADIKRHICEKSDIQPTPARTIFNL